MLLNTAVSRANDPVQMARAFADAIRAGRSSFLAGPMVEQETAVPSTTEIEPTFHVRFRASVARECGFQLREFDVRRQVFTGQMATLSNSLVFVSPATGLRKFSYDPEKEPS